MPRAFLCAIMTVSTELSVSSLMSRPRCLGVDLEVFGPLTGCDRGVLRGVDGWERTGWVTIC